VGFRSSAIAKPLLVRPDFIALVRGVETTCRIRAGSREASRDTASWGVIVLSALARRSATPWRLVSSP
jgi:hypothetical protein